MGQVVAARGRSNQGWNTPPWLLELVAQVGPIALDPCPSDGGLWDGLTSKWFDPDAGADERYLVYVNPPWRQAARWVAKCAEEAGRTRGGEVIYVGPASTETKYFHDWIMPTADRVCFLRGRVAFVDPATGEVGKSPPCGVMVVYWGPRGDEFEAVFGPRGWVW